MELLHSGKIRDVYEDRGDILLVASDKVSVYNVVLPTPIPGKGKILTQLSLWWFRQLAGVVPNHVISAEDVPAEWAGRAIRCQRLNMLPIECIARGYLAGLGLDSYRASGTISGVPLPPGLAEGSRLPEPVFTPSTKATTGHDEFMTLADAGREARRRDSRRTPADHAGGLQPRRRYRRRARRHHRRHQARIWPGPRWRPGPGRRAAHVRLVALLGRRRLAAGQAAALPR